MRDGGTAAVAATAGVTLPVFTVAAVVVDGKGVCGVGQTGG